MSGFDYYLKVWKNYANFEGRARRSEYWYFTLFNTLVTSTISILGYAVSEVFLGLYGLYIMAVIIPTIAVAVRRLHDTDRGGVTVLLSFIPLVGGIILLVYFVQEGTVGANKYGEDPKQSIKDELFL